MNKKAQVAIFIIVAAVIALSVVIFLVVRNQIKIDEIPTELSPVFDYYRSCIEIETSSAIQLAGTQGGYVETTEYIPGSEFAPFSSHLNFLGFPVPYWYYISANGLIKEQVPTKQEIERQTEKFIEEGLQFCNFDNFYLQGFNIEIKEPKAKVTIDDDRINVEVASDLTVSRGETSARKTTHSTQINTKFGKFYKLAKEIYNKQKTEAFLENYALDVLRVYTPVDGVEIQCAPKLWSTRAVTEDLKQGLEANIQAIKFKGDYYTPKKEREYFIVDKEVDEQINLLYSRRWPTKVEIYGEGVDSELMVAEPIGTQEGLGIMGFCYIPYHFVYDISFPVLIQIVGEEDIFQFPVAVIIDNNVPRQANLPETAAEEPDFNLCEFRTQEIQVNVYNTNLNKIDANISYECFQQSCRLGQTQQGTLSTFAPACINGYLKPQAGGYAEKKQIFSTNEQTTADIVLEREYEVEVELRLNSIQKDHNAIVSFVKEDGKSASAALPEVSKVRLTEGSYKVKVYVYGNSSIVIPESTKTQCIETPQEGILGFFGGKQEKCFDIKVPGTRIDYALIGGGKTTTYILESDLQKGKVIVQANALPPPTSLEQLQNNFEIFEKQGVFISFV